MTIASNLTSKNGRNFIKILAKNYQNNWEFDCPETIKNLTQNFH